MMLPINERVQHIQLSGIRQFFNLVAQEKDIISLTIGQPDFPTPEHIKEATKRALDEQFTSYTHNAGYLPLREAACRFVETKYGLRYTTDEVIVTVGASQALDITFRTILTEGSEVILPAPIYPGYEPIIRLCGATPVYVDTRQTNFKLLAEQIEPFMTERTRCIVLPYPSNPTGMTLTSDELQQIAQLVKDKPIWVISDEIYSELVFTGTHESIAKWLPDQTIVINGVSKSHAMTGFRIGLLFARQWVIEHILKVHQYNVSCATSISQKAALEALTVGINDAEEMKQQYKKRMVYVYERLQSIGFDVQKPNGAFYIFPSIAPFHHSSFEFALKLAKEAKVAVVPGSAFSTYGEGYIRLSYACSMDALQKGLDRIESYIKKGAR
ncbi:aromatic amino acid aminotransferase [Anoxybacillus gonensis]|uniref:Aminotransferase n=1 Tax=Anoxybacillus gonensis TaxID=198467 RepID=A0AAW7THH2_9BACL|nr:aminotransferase A [Anoxybacillus gonensis]AKS37848.1 aromatic amino acid aminotransferase [Anoxybacillus gonensis]KGP61853.1 aromatic amino acid aminotransferase [Anoxybacillus gonensis]MCX8046347.1 aminotransferase A [Anoxybacillus gonensis]MDO0877557.1 aminotransferase A [Anoxybacillus gonensis]